MQFPEDPSKQQAVQDLSLASFISSQLVWLKEELSPHKCTNARVRSLLFHSVFSHNDLLSGNILLLHSGELRFIDFEYGAYNFRGYDFGNHFCEYAGFDFDLEKSYPSRAQAKLFLKAYFEDIEDADEEFWEEMVSSFLE